MSEAGGDSPADPYAGDGRGENGFYAWLTPSLRGRGLAGKRLEVFCIDGVLLIRGADGTALDLPAAAVDRLRLGFTSSKTAVYYEARLFLAGEAEPLLLKPKDTRCPTYGATMRRFAGAVARVKGLERIERGLTARSALIGFLIVLAVTTGASLMAVFVWSRKFGMVGAIVFVLAMIAATALMGWHALYREKPMPVSALDELERYLPKRA